MYKLHKIHVESDENIVHYDRSDIDLSASRVH